MAEPTKRSKPVAHDESPSIIDDHAFDPKGEWWSLCKHCNHAESAHKETTRTPIRYYSDDNPEVDEPVPITWEGDST